MIQNDEAPGSSSATESGDNDCVKCGTSYSSRVEWVQHLLLHIERSYPVVALNREDIDNFEGTKNNQSEMSEEGETEMTQNEEVETKPKLNNNFDSHADSNYVSSSKEGERRGSLSGESDSMSICSSTGAPPQAAEVPKMVVKAEVHAPDAEVVASDGKPPQMKEANGRRSSESSQGKDQSGAEEEDDDGKTSDGSKSPPKPTTPSLPFAITLRKSEDLMAQTNYNLIQEDFPNGDFHGAQKDLYRCALCPRSFVTAAELDAHAAAEGHIICSMSEACASLSFTSPAALSHHQAMVHQAPAQTTAVQRLAAQVERLPQTFGTYPPQIPPTPYGGPAYNLPQAPYPPPKLGSQVVLTPMSAPVVVPPPPQPNLPNLPGIQVTKRPAPPPVDSSPSKINRGEDGVPSIRLPDSITLVKSQPAPPQQNAVADMLATRGITMVASGSRAGPTPSTSIQPVAPPKRLPNVPSAISIVPSRPQPAQQVQRFAVPPAPAARGRHMTNLGTVDLTREDAQNGRPRGSPGRPMVASSRRFSCTICDKVYPTGESLQAHMAVHGSNNKPGRYMCEICRVVYTNEAKLQHHKKTVHAVRSATDTEMVIPICDINQPGVKEKLLQCGIRHVVQVQSIRNANDTAAFGLPIIPIDLARNEAYSRLDDLGASNILSLGNLRNIYR
uniref:C2H2-type domain-containing protein n=4 Tax=Lygus hesperus TaxID=30085 RepID=A0A146LJ00_LYGHE